jgi:hypothetical protein
VGRGMPIFETSARPLPRGGSAGKGWSLGACPLKLLRDGLTMIGSRPSPTPNNRWGRC